MVVCHACRAQEAARRIWQHVNEKQPYMSEDGSVRAKEFSLATPHKFDDGARLIVTPDNHDPDETWRR